VEISAEQKYTGMEDWFGKSVSSEVDYRRRRPEPAPLEFNTSLD
jgi:hypothetical protein